MSSLCFYAEAYSNQLKCTLLYRTCKKHCSSFHMGAMSCHPASVIYSPWLAGVLGISTYKYIGKKTMAELIADRLA